MAKFASLEGAIVTIRNWEKFNYRKDVTRASWFRLDHSIFDDKDLFDFTGGELLAWFYLLCQASKKSSASVEISVNHVVVIGRCTEFDMQTALIKLSKRGIVSVVAPEKKRKSANDTLRALPLAGVGGGNIHTNKTDTHTPPSADLEKLYREYPNKKGKRKGMLLAEKLSSDQLPQLLEAIRAYALECKRDRTEKKYIKHFSSFMGCWEDYIPLEPVKLKTLEDLTKESEVQSA